MSKKSSAKRKAKAARATKPSAGRGFFYLAAGVVLAMTAAYFLWPAPGSDRRQPAVDSTAAALSLLSTSAPAAAVAPAVALPTSLTGDPNPELATQLMAEGTRMLQSGRLKESLAYFRAAVYHNPEDEDIRYNYAINLAAAGEIEEAIKQYNEALRIFPDYVEARNNLGTLYTNLKKYAEATRQFEEVIRLMPEHSIAHNNLGRVLGEQRKFREAILEFAEAVRLDPKYERARFNLGNAFIDQKKKAEAIEQFNELLKLDPSPALAELAKAGIARAQQLTD